MTSSHLVTTADYSRGALTTHGADAVRNLVGAWLVEFPSARTREAYLRDLEHFARWLSSEAKVPDLLAATRPHVALYARTLAESGRYKPATQARRLSAVSSFYGYALEAGAVVSNPAARVRRPKLPAYSPRLGLNLDTAPRVLEAVEGMSAAHRGLVALCLFAGLRVSEALSVTTHDLRTEAGHRVLRVTSKGGRDDLVPLSPPALRLLEGLLDSPSRPARPLLRTDDGTPLDRFRARRMVAAIGRRAGLPEAITSHDLRHGAVTCALEAGEPLHRVQQLARHASPVTTQRYDHSRDRLDRSAAYGLGVALSGRKRGGAA
jgi:site-specific recombinase XerD